MATTRVIKFRFNSNLEDYMNKKYMEYLAVAVEEVYKW